MEPYKILPLSLINKVLWIVGKKLGDVVKHHGGEQKWVQPSQNGLLLEDRIIIRQTYAKVQKIR